jgi:hypothetical protein
MATETESGEDLGPRARHRRSITVTSVAALAGLLAGVASDAVATGASDRIGLGLMGAAVVLSFGVIHVAGVDVTEFSKKDVVYVVFMAFSLWFVTWTILLTSASGA